MNVVILTCGDLGARVAESLVEQPEVESVAVVYAPYRTRSRTLLQKIRHIYRMQGVAGFLRVAAEKFRRTLRPASGSNGPRPRRSDLDGVTLLRFEDFHDPECLAAISDLRPDLGVLAGTYILKPAVFEIPRLGTINLHTGKVPEYRGAAPVFWELYHGESEVGITVHRVTAELDAGAVLAQETFPLDPAPQDDPMEYIRQYREETLHPNGVRMLVQVVRDIATGRADEWRQDPSRATTYPSPTHKDVRELRRRVAARRGREGTET